MYTKYVLLIFSWGVFVPITRGNTSTAIPAFLQNCYRSNYTESFPKPPLTIHLLIQILRKLELSPSYSLNMRLLTTSMLAGVRMDGIQWNPSVTEENFRIPYRAVGNQFYLYKLLVDYLTPGESSLFPYDSLTISERCLLHEIISNTIDPWERGDESKTCDSSNMAHVTKTAVEYVSTRQTSDCPVEKGVVKSKWGSVSPGRIIAGVASALQLTHESFKTLSQTISTQSNSTNQRWELYNTLVSNIWVSTVAGDLGESIVNQAVENAEIGNVGYWNDTSYPRMYLVTGKNFDLTEAELLGGVDGAILALKIKEWTDILSSTRLSQIIDMYYSNRGVSYNSTYKSCNRFTLFKQLLENTDLEAQVSGAARLLSESGEPTGYLSDDAIEHLTYSTMINYKATLDEKALMYNSCNLEVKYVPSSELITILDSFWDDYNTKTLLSTLIEEADISYYGSEIGLLNGQTGRWLTNISSDIVQLYQELDDDNNTWPSAMSLGRSLEQVITYYQNNTRPDCKSSRIKPKRPVVIVLAISSRITDSDWNQAFSAIRSIKNTNPETSILYVTSQSNKANYEKLAESYGNDEILVSTDSVESIVGQITEKLANIPGHIVNFYCNESQVHLEDYVIPGLTTFYEIHETYLHRANVNVKFKGNDYGSLVICAYAKNFKDIKVCKNITVNDEVIFNASDHCYNISCSVQFAIDANDSKFKCTEADCRYPDQVRLDIYTSWSLKSGSLTLSLNILVFVVLLIPNVISMY